MNDDLPYRGFNFKVEIDGIAEAGFQECTGGNLARQLACG